MEQKRQRHRRFWQPLTAGEGAYFSITSPIDDSGVTPCPLEPPKTVEERWLSTEYSVKRAEAEARNIYWGQDAIQSVFVNIGPGVHAALLGAPYELRPESVWFDLAPPIKGWEPPPQFHTDENHPLYKAIESQTRALCKASQGRYGVSFTDIGGQMDVLFSLRGEDLLMDLIEYPEEVIAAQKQLDREFLRYFNSLAEIIGPAGLGFTSWIPPIHDRPWYPLQCDMSVMISPAMFERFVLPSLSYLSKEIGCAIYHLDGPEEIQHLDMILSIPEVHAIQWVPLPALIPGTGRSEQNFRDSMSLEVYKRSLAAGKKVVLLGIPPRQIPEVIGAVGADGLYFASWPSTRKEADELIGAAHSNGWIR